MSNHTSECIEKTLEAYNDFLLKLGYTDADIYAEEPSAIERFLKENPISCHTPKKVECDDLACLCHRGMGTVPVHTPKQEKVNYNHVSHTHCWNNSTPPCGISLEKHKQCCLCDLKPPQQADEWEALKKELEVDDTPNGYFVPYHFMDNVQKILTQEKEKAYKKGLEESQSSLLQSLADEVGEMKMVFINCEGAIDRHWQGYNSALSSVQELILNRIKK